MIGINSSRKLINYEKLKVKLTDVKGVGGKRKGKKGNWRFSQKQRTRSENLQRLFLRDLCGAGKTLFTKAIAGETVVHYISISWFHPSPKFLCGWTQTVCKIVLKTIKKN